MRPEIPHLVARGRETEIAPRVMNALFCLADVEDGDVSIPASLRSRRPDHDVVSCDDWTIVRRVLIDRDNLGVG